ncbi:MAG: hypothetical protein Kow0090_19520 [Myxococcota bacterium]
MIRSRKRGMNEALSKFSEERPRKSWLPSSPECDSGEIYCPKKQGIMAEGKCIKLQNKEYCGADCDRAVKDKGLIWKANPSRYYLESNEGLERRGRGNYNKWEELKRLIGHNGGTINAYELMNAFDLASYEAAAMMLRYYEKKELLIRERILGLRPQQYRLSERVKKETEARKEAFKDDTGIA